jgi:hypothetical protein
VNLYKYFKVLFASPTPQWVAEVIEALPPAHYRIELLPGRNPMIVVSLETFDVGARVIVKDNHIASAGPTGDVFELEI